MQLLAYCVLVYAIDIVYDICSNLLRGSELTRASILYSKIIEKIIVISIVQIRVSVDAKISEENNLVLVTEKMTVTK